MEQQNLKRWCHNLCNLSAPCAQRSRNFKESFRFPRKLYRRFLSPNANPEARNLSFSEGYRWSHLKDLPAHGVHWRHVLLRVLLLARLPCPIRRCHIFDLPFRYSSNSFYHIDCEIFWSAWYDKRWKLNFVQKILIECFDLGTWKVLSSVYKVSYLEWRGPTRRGVWGRRLGR